jgi:hypothetical protein
MPRGMIIYLSDRNVIFIAIPLDPLRVLGCQYHILAF